MVYEKRTAGNFSNFRLDKDSCSRIPWGQRFRTVTTGGVDARPNRALHAGILLLSSEALIRLEEMDG